MYSILRTGLPSCNGRIKFVVERDTCSHSVTSSLCGISLWFVKIMPWKLCRTNMFCGLCLRVMFGILYDELVVRCVPGTPTVNMRECC